MLEKTLFLLDMTMRRLLGLTLLVPSTYLLLAGCSPGDETPSGVADADGDKVADTLGKATGPFDINKDGTPDGTGIDTNSDGKPDGIGIDQDKDGIFEAIDRDGDGKPDSSVGGTGSGGSSSGTGGSIILPPGNSTGGSLPEDCNPDKLVIPITVRDFSESHIDMEETFAGDGVRTFLVKPDLGSDKRPVFNDTAAFGKNEKPGIGCSADQPNNCMYFPTQAVISSKESFDQWYHDTATVNQSFDKEITLLPDSSGSFVFDSQGTVGFFPLSPSEGFGITPAGNGKGQNYLFTTEIHLEFGYQKGQKFTFRGDDDVWVFINNKLALDLGGMHLPAEGTIDFDAQATALGITPGQNYAMDVFHAERHTSDSNFRIETNIGCFKPVIVVK